MPTLNFGASSLNIGTSFFTGVGNAVQDLLSSSTQQQSAQMQAQGDLAEAQQYKLAATLAGQNVAETAESANIQDVMAQRKISQSLGSTQAETAAAGFANSGSALYVLRSSAQQGALQQQIIGEQAKITEAGYTEQQAAYTSMSNEAEQAAQEEENLGNSAAMGGTIGSVVSGIAGVASLFAVL